MTDIEPFQQLILKSPARLASLLGFKNNWHHIEWYEYLNNPLIQRIVLMAPREHAKSTAFSVIYPLFTIVKNPNIRIVIISNTATQAEAFLRQTVSIIETDQRFLSVFGNLKPAQPEKWTDREIIVKRTSTDKDATISTTGAGGPILSKRADIVILDDILNKSNTRTIEQRRKIREWFNDVVMPVVVKDGKVIWIATAFNTEDLTHELMKNPMFDVKKVYKAITKEADNLELWEQYKELVLTDNKDGKAIGNQFYFEHQKQMDKGAETLWPERYTYKELFDKRIETGVRSFNLMYQNEAINDEDAIIKAEWVEQCLDIKRSLMDQYKPEASDLGPLVIVQGVDLAISENETADWNVITTLAYTQENKFVILNRVRGHWTPSEIRQNIIGQATRFNPQVIFVEDNAFQASLVKDLQNMTPLPIKGFTTSGEKYDPFIGINSIAVALENKQFVIPANPQDVRTVDYVNEIKEEMIAFPSGHTGDSLMSLYFAFTALRSLLSTNEGVAVSMSGMYSGVKL